MNVTAKKDLDNSSAGEQEDIWHLTASANKIPFRKNWARGIGFEPETLFIHKYCSSPLQVYE